MEFSFVEIQAAWVFIRGAVFTVLLGFGAAALRIMLTKDKHGFLYFCIILTLSGVAAYALAALLKPLDIQNSVKEMIVLVSCLVVYDLSKLTFRKNHEAPTKKN